MTGAQGHSAGSGGVWQGAHVYIPSEETKDERTQLDTDTLSETSALYALEVRKTKANDDQV